MKEEMRIGCNPVCACEHPAPSLRVLRSTTFNVELARFIDDLGLSGEGTIDWVLSEIFECRAGALIGGDGRKLAINTDPSLTDDLFGVDARRGINAFVSRARRHHRNRLQSRMVMRVLIMHFAREIYLCRKSGCGVAR